MSAAPSRTRRFKKKACPNFELPTFKHTFPERQLDNKAPDADTNCGQQRSYENTVLLKVRKKRSLVTRQNRADDRWNVDTLKTGVDNDSDKQTINIDSKCGKIIAKTNTNQPKERDKGDNKLTNPLQRPPRKLPGLVDGRRCTDIPWPFLRMSDHSEKSPYSVGNTFNFTLNQKANLCFGQSVKGKNKSLEDKSKSTEDGYQKICYVQGERGRIKADSNSMKFSTGNELQEKTEVSIIKGIQISDINVHFISRVQGTTKTLGAAHNAEVKQCLDYQSHSLYRTFKPVVKTNTAREAVPGGFYPLRKAHACTELSNLHEQQPVRVPGCTLLASIASTDVCPQVASVTRLNCLSLIEKGYRSPKSGQGTLFVTKHEELDQTEAEHKRAENETEDVDQIEAEHKRAEYETEDVDQIEAEHKRAEYEAEDVDQTEAEHTRAENETEEVDQTGAEATRVGNEAEDTEEPSPADKDSNEESKIEEMFTGKEICGYKFIEKFASGASSVIFKVTKNNIPYAAKVFKRIYSNPLKSLNLMHHEFKLLKKLQHPYVIQVFTRFVSMSYGVIVMEYMDGGNLWTHYEQEWPVQEEVTKKILWEILTAIRFVHKQRIVHMDIKSNNFLIDSNGCVKLTDFGGAKRFGGFYKRGSRVSFFTPEWAPPEKQLERENGTPIFVLHKRFDMWSFGVLVYQLFTGKLPYSLIEGRRFLPRETFKEPVQLPDEQEEDNHLLSLIRGCMRINPVDRLRSKQALLHPFFDSVRRGA